MSKRQKQTPMKYIFPIVSAYLLLSLATSSAFAQGAGREWEILIQEVVELYNAGKYDSAVVVARKALEVAEKIVGPDHTDVATSLENLANLYRATKRDKEAEELELRVAKIRSIKR